MCTVVPEWNMSLVRLVKYGCVLVMLLLSAALVTQWSVHFSVQSSSSVEVTWNSQSLSELGTGKERKGVAMESSNGDLKSGIHSRNIKALNSTNGQHDILPPSSIESTRMGNISYLQEHFSPLLEEDISSVEKFIYFVGYPRSGHSIIGSMLDAHPKIIIAHEYDLFRQWAGKSEYCDRQCLYNTLFRNSHNNALHGLRSAAEMKKGYTLEMAHSWQGAFRRLKIIGDKAGAMTSRQYNSSPSEFVKNYHRLEQTVHVPIRAFHIVRNPFDMIATRLLYSVSDTKGAKLSTATEDHKYSNSKQLGYHIYRVFSIAEQVQGIINDCNLTVLEIHNADFIADPKRVLRKACRFLEIDCPEDYLQMCYDKMYRSLSRTRLLVEWPQALIDRVLKQMEKFSFFHRYSFEL